METKAIDDEKTISSVRRITFVFQIPFKFWQTLQFQSNTKHEIRDNDNLTVKLFI
ncbi:hypothetical protein KGMB02408_14340 [Bacteroides faecalis]|uniref:Uncharacterized protein n=1 Tax=Bacteroides faecalis TaxID=2447885 RepID=A0A401LSM0_9BACE|nr:hypothetical protein KGMB02408_14340 [Bacteroides faecalis]